MVSIGTPVRTFRCSVIPSPDERLICIVAYSAGGMGSMLMVSTQLYHLPFMFQSYNGSIRANERFSSLLYEFGGAKTSPNSYFIKPGISQPARHPLIGGLPLFSEWTKITCLTSPDCTRIIPATSRGVSGARTDREEGHWLEAFPGNNR